jgi:hypothetical protein
MTDFRLHHFVLREEGLKWIKEMPKYPQFTDSLVGVMLDDIYQSEVQSAIESAILVSNQEDTLLHLRKAFAKSKNASEVVMMAKDLFPIMDQVYSLECAVEVKQRFNQLSKEAYNAPDNLNRDIPLLGHYQTVAIVTFPQAKEDQPGEADKVEELKPMPDKDGWSFDYNLLCEIEKQCSMRDEFISLEAVDATLMSLIDLGFTITRKP